MKKRIEEDTPEQLGMDDGDIINVDIGVDIGVEMGVGIGVAMAPRAVANALLALWRAQRSCA